jgi:hypothetical protein
MAYNPGKSQRSTTDMFGSIRPNKKIKEDLAQGWNQMKSDPASIGPTESERERSMAIAQRLGGDEAAAKASQAHGDLKYKAAQAFSHDMRNRMERQAKVAREQRAKGGKAAAAGLTTLAGVVTAQPTLVGAGLSNLTGQEIDPEGLSKEKYEESALGKYLSGKGTA